MNFFPKRILDELNIFSIQFRRAFGALFTE